MDLVEAVGDVRVVQENKTEAPARAGEQIPAGAWLRTGADGRCVTVASGGISWTLLASSQVQVTASAATWPSGPWYTVKSHNLGCLLGPLVSWFPFLGRWLRLKTTVPHQGSWPGSWPAVRARGGTSWPGTATRGAALGGSWPGTTLRAAARGGSWPGTTLRAAALGGSWPWKTTADAGSWPGGWGGTARLAELNGGMVVSSGSVASDGECFSGALPFAGFVAGPGHLLLRVDSQSRRVTLATLEGAASVEFDGGEAADLTPGQALDYGYADQERLEIGAPRALKGEELALLEGHRWEWKDALAVTVESVEPDRCRMTFREGVEGVFRGLPTPLLAGVEMRGGTCQNESASCTGWESPQTVILEPSDWLADPEAGDPGMLRRKERAGKLQTP